MKELMLADFEQSYEQLRHYDSQIIGTVKFLLVFYTGAFSVLIGGYECISPETKVLWVRLLLSLSFVAGIIGLIILVSTRTYFVRVARLLNEMRSIYVSDATNAFSNHAGMPVDVGFPRFYNPTSSHSFFVYLVSVINAFIGGALCFGLIGGVSVSVLAGTSLLAIQVLTVIRYLQKKR